MNTKDVSQVPKHKYRSINRRINFFGWRFVIPASLLIFVLNFYPMIRAFILSLNKVQGLNHKYVGLANYERMLRDPVFHAALKNTFIYLIIQVPIMLVLAMFLAQLLNNPHLKMRGLFRTMIFLPCATSLVSYSIVFRSLFANEGIVNKALLSLGLIQQPWNWLANEGTARVVIILALLWRWTGYNMIFFLAGLQNIDASVYEAAEIDGCNKFQSFFKITVPLLRPMILLTTIMSINGTLQLFDESYNLTKGGPSNATITISHYIYKLSFRNNPRFGYAAAMSYVVFILIAILSLIQITINEKKRI